MKNHFLIFSIILTSTFGFSQKTEKEAVVETPEMHVFYEGIPIELKASANGDYKKVTMSVPSPYTAAPGTAGQTIVVTLSGTDSKGNSVSLGSKKFLVKKAPKPELVWNGILSGERANKSGGALTCRYGNNVPFNPSKGSFSITQYSITAEGLSTVLSGAGSTISSDHLAILKGLKEGSKIAIQVQYTGSGSGTVSAIFN
jgi:hypothetical protein